LLVLLTTGVKVLGLVTIVGLLLITVVLVTGGSTLWLSCASLFNISVEIGTYLPSEFSIFRIVEPSANMNLVYFSPVTLSVHGIKISFPCGYGVRLDLLMTLLLGVSL
jgi:hypothetical protein